jgi:hypothetical protein
MPTIPQAAIENTETTYLQKCLAQRNPGEHALGSRFESPQSFETLCGARWEPYPHPDVKAPAVAYRASIPGYFGLVRLDSLSVAVPVTLQDPKGTGFVEATVKLPKGLGPRVEFTTLLLGPGDDGKLGVWTFFPGEPIPPSAISSKEMNGKTITVLEALALGLVWAKVA